MLPFRRNHYSCAYDIIKNVPAYLQTQRKIQTLLSSMIVVSNARISAVMDVVKISRLVARGFCCMP